jgi:hypothetical protein
MDGPQVAARIIREYENTPMVDPPLANAQC